MGYLFMAYTIIWGLLAGYIFILGKRQKDLKKELQVLEDWNAEK
ncbi:CcmD family protein [Cytobacillus eiseniae]|uniref:CcmD family protein n=1 Tax=Cytobacillus eiseniae TaxID=762947 RepID=A0ABS4RF20_9BACI|nr:CcmD family protein [Cytobacillus eiseniae]MBP2241491.1 CcmD family protein [Cytobacillus eiseniae]